MDEFKNLLKQLISFKTTTCNKEEIKKCMSFIEDYFTALNITFQKFERNHSISLLVTPQKEYCPILLMSHTDVVPGSDNQFKPYEKNGAIYGRGAVDDKYAVVLSMLLLKKHILQLKAQKKNQVDLPFGILITSDEETGGYHGANLVLPMLKTEFCIALDGGSLEKIVVKEKGLISAKLVSTGKAAHSSRPWLGENAIQILIRDIEKLNQLFTMDRKDYWQKTMTVSKIVGGESLNQVPNKATAYLDIRYTETDNPDILWGKMQSEINSDLTFKEVVPMFYSQESPYLEKLLSLSPGTKTIFEHGSSDARYLQEYKIPGIIWGANGNMSQHSGNEHIDIDSANALFNLLDRFVSN